MNNPITAAIIGSMTAPAPAQTITVTWANGTRATYSATMLDLLRTDPAALDIQDDDTGELVYIKPDPDAATLAPADAACVWDEDGNTITPEETTTNEQKEEAQTMKPEHIIEWFEEHEDVFNDCIEELDSWNGYLGDDRYYNMDELSELYHDTDPIELLNRAYFGYDAETWHTDAHGEKEYGPFNPNREYFTFNGYGNFVSADYKDYSGHLDEYFIEALNENREHIWTVEQNDELREMLESLDDEDDTAEDDNAKETC